MALPRRQAWIVRIGFEVILGAPEASVTILHVEDDVNDAELIYRELRRAELKFTATRVETEAEFRAGLAGRLPDVILADYRLPTFDGLRALAITCDVAPSVPFIFVSGSLGEERAIDALREGATDYILKDHPGRLGAAVRRALREAEQRRARKRAEQAVIESEQRFRYAISATRDVIWDHDLVAGTVYVNDAMRTTWGHPEESGDLAYWVARIHPDDRDAVMHSYKRWLESTDPRWTFEFRFQRGDGTYGSVVERSLVLRDEAGRPLRVIGAMQDTTEMRRMQEQIDRAERVESLGRVAATIAHEFNNVLMGIQPIGELIVHQHEAIAPLGRRILDSVGRGRRIVDEILRMSRVPEPKAENFDLATLLTGMRSEIESVAGPRVRVVLAQTHDPTFIHCDRDHLRQVLINLTANARDAMPEGGALTFAPASVAGEVVLSVTDQGSGIPANVREHIFEPLFTTKPTGTGLGLAVSHRLLTQNGASIAVDCKPGGGTTFRITFPRVSGGSVKTPEVWPARRLTAALRILMVEDNLNVAEGVRLLLETQGFETHVVERGGDVPDAVRTWAPDIVLLDLSLPDISGLDVFDRLSVTWPELPIVLMSGHIDPQGVNGRMQRTNAAFLRKPFDLESLLKAIDHITGPKGESKESAVVVSDR